MCSSDLNAHAPARLAAGRVVTGRHLQPHAAARLRETHRVGQHIAHHLRDTGFVLRISHSLRELWIRSGRPRALGLSDHQIAAQLRVPLATWLDCRRACGQRPAPLPHDS